MMQRRSFIGKLLWQRDCLHHGIKAPRIDPQLDTAKQCCDHCHMYSHTAKLCQRPAHPPDFARLFNSYMWTGAMPVADCVRARVVHGLQQTNRFAFCRSFCSKKRGASRRGVPRRTVLFSRIFCRTGCPPSCGAAGQDEAVGGDRQADLAGFHTSVADGIQHRVEHVAEDGGLQARCVGIDQDEEGRFG